MEGTGKVVVPPQLPSFFLGIRFFRVEVTNIEADLVKCEPGSADPSTMETRLLRLVRTLAEAPWHGLDEQSPRGVWLKNWGIGP